MAQMIPTGRRKQGDPKNNNTRANDDRARKGAQRADRPTVSVLPPRLRSC